jgi:hypothetical protein
VSAEIIAKGRRAAVAEGQDPTEVPIVITFTIGDHTSLVFTTTNAGLGGPDSEAIDGLVENFDEHVLTVLEAMAATLDGQGGSQ